MDLFPRVSDAEKCVPLVKFEVVSSLVPEKVKIRAVILSRSALLENSNGVRRRCFQGVDLSGKSNLAERITL
jgi:hypothetical protein